MKYVMMILIIFATFVQNISGEEWQRYINLRGAWKFMVGDDKNFASSDYSDDNWEDIYVPSSWEDEGFYGYNGYAWYRKTVVIPQDEYARNLYLFLGYIDDVDEVYFNGTLIGFTGTFPPGYETAYYAKRQYYIPPDLVKRDDENIIAVRVYDSQLSGGIVSGDIGIYIPEQKLKIEIDLVGKWKFRTGDNMEWKNEDYNDEKWRELMVPAFWEGQGYRNYDGVAWYRKHFKTPKDLNDDKYVVVLGKIDDLDEAYLNGKRIGSTGVIRENVQQSRFDYEYQEIRGYFIETSLLNPDGDNVIAVRVYDGYKDGGIYEGPIGLVSRTEYTKFWKEKRRKKNFFEYFFGN